MSIRRLFLLAIIGILPVLLFFSCASVKRAQQEESFEMFYEKFHKDSLFQLSRLELPMQGLVIEGNRIQPGFDETWALHKVGKGDLDAEIFKVEWERRRERVVERIYEPGSVLYNERHFELINGKWFLVYFLNIFVI